MSIWNYIFDNEYMQRADIEALKRNQSAAIRARSRQAMHAEARQKEMEDEIGELALFCRTAVTLMIEKGLITQQEFVNRMQQVDASDGKIDGQFKPKTK